MFPSLLFRRALRAAVLSCAAVVSVFPAAAQTVVIVTGTRNGLPVERLVGDVVLIDAERIRSSAADSLEDLLRREAGLQLSRNGGPGANAGLFIRGAGSGNTLVLVDGVRLGAATTGLAELEALSLGAVERIEILRGPASSLYGADAVGGVVQIFTRRGQGPARLAAQVAVGGQGGREASLSADGAGGGFDLAASLSSERNDGVSALRPNDLFGNHNPDRDGFSRRSAQAQVGFTPAAGQRLGLQATASRLRSQYDGSEFAPPTYTQDNTPEFRNRLDLDAVSIDHRARWNAGFSTLLRWASQRSDLDAGGHIIDHFRTDRRQFEAQLNWLPAADQQLTLAWERLDEASRSTSYSSDVQRDNDALVLAYAGRVGPVDLQADLRRDDNSVWGAVDTGRLGAGLALAGGWRVRALAGTTFRAPSFNDLYYPGYGVATIRPERGRSVELGLRWSAAGSEASATLYRNRVRDLIGYEGDRNFCPSGSDYDFGCARNVGRARLQGATLSGSTRRGAWSLRGTLDFLDAKDAATGARLTRRAAHQESLAADWRDGAWSAGAELLRVGARPEAGDTLAAYATVDFKLRWQFAPSWQVLARLLNAFDRDYEPALDYRPLGRQAWLGLRYAGAGW